MAKTSPTSALPVNDMVCFAAYSTSMAFTRFYNPLLKPLGLTYPQYLVMNVLWAEDDVNVKTIGEALHLESNNLTPLLKKLEAAGHLTRTRDPADERQNRIRLTPTGRALQQQAAHIPGCIVEQLGCSIQELQDLIQQLTSVRQALEAQ